MRIPSWILWAVGAVAALLLMAWIVDLRTAGMSMDDMPNPAGAPMRPGQDLSKLTVGGSGLPVLAPAMPEFAGIAEWMNTEPLTAEGLKGKVVLIDFWTYSCINCIRTLPYVTAWHDKYVDEGFTVIGVHTPEFAFEKESKNVRAAIARHAIHYPVALDNDYATWNAYSNRYWPAHYLFDAQGRLRFTHFGEGKYEETERHIRALLAEAGESPEEGMVEVGQGPDFARVASPETYVGYARQERLASPEPVERDVDSGYTEPAELRLNDFALSGSWNIQRERAVLADGMGAIAYRYSASAANLVMGAPAEVVAEVTLDGAPVPEALRGADVYEEGGRTYLRIQEERLYAITDAKGVYAEHLLRIRFLTPGVSVYAFTFG